MIFVIIAVLAGIVGGLMAQAKGKDVFLWGLLCAFFPIAILILAFKDGEASQTFHTPLRQHTASIPQPVEAKPATVGPLDNPAWKTLKEFDTDIQEAVAKLAGFGPQAEERLATAYMSVSDKGLLPSIVAKITADEEKHAVAREEETARQVAAKSEREKEHLNLVAGMSAVQKEILAEREARAAETIALIKEAGMVYDGWKVVSVDMYYGKGLHNQGWAKIVYEDGRTELRAGSSWMLMKA